MTQGVHIGERESRGQRTVERRLQELLDKEEYGKPCMGIPRGLAGATAS